MLPLPSRGTVPVSQSYLVTHTTMEQRREKEVHRGCCRRVGGTPDRRVSRMRKALAPMPEEPEKAINLLWAVDEIIIALQQLRERLRRMAQQDGPPRKPRKTRS